MKGRWVSTTAGIFYFILAERNFLARHHTHTPGERDPRCSEREDLQKPRDTSPASLPWRTSVASQGVATV